MLDNIIDLNLLTRFFNNLKTYITELLSTKQDTLTSGANVKTINNESILGSGNISTSKPVLEVTGTSISIRPDIYHIKTDQTDSLQIFTITPLDNTIMHEYVIEFTTSTTGTTISLPNTIKWANGQAPTFESNTTYQISIVNNLGVCIKFA